jgi:hypothetical protein
LPEAQIEKKLKGKLMRDDFSYRSNALKGVGSISSEVGRYPMIKAEVADTVGSQTVVSLTAVH